MLGELSDTERRSLCVLSNVYFKKCWTDCKKQLFGAHKEVEWHVLPKSCIEQIGSKSSASPALG